ncbi:FRG domain-containing protein [Firmicutes bacterium AM29-6AC]|uniref:FRG domain-containing protein n=1 Tax=Anaerotignum faecicola TaxID=2358141 RepID=A0A401LEH0_9FIRM|nr:FRG domain-containing protein [Anaerotignum faecicola]RHR12447.1 FRG domain-containing protein [Firmicutes bacterium AF19-2LB]RHT37812.1 FRG domain-containing protein [Firmicutes bacterium AM29-6AC]GCB29971.1 hypothetical protein KGMB03357_16320 [Anaerotignum faecicola]
MSKFEEKDTSDIIVNSVEEVYAVIDKYNQEFHLPRKGGNTETRAFYRGQSNFAWKIEPSILRCSEDEGVLYRKNQSNLEGKDLFAQFAFLQHYGTGTRMIDFTTNPEVAMYFACEKDPLLDAALYLYTYNAHKAEWIDTLMFTELMQMKGYNTIKINSFSEQLLKKYPILSQRFVRTAELNMFLMAYLDHGYMVLPTEDVKIHNIRIRNQEGVFFICGVEFTKDITTQMRFESQAGFNEFISHSINIPDSLKAGSVCWKIHINKSLKPQILSHLAKKGITREYLFPDINVSNNYSVR